VAVGDIGFLTALDSVLTRDWDDGFSDTNFDFTATAGNVGVTWWTWLQQLTVPQAGGGILVDRVTFKQMTPTEVVLLDWTFDAENPQVIQPPCPSAYAYIYTNCGGYGCLDNPPGAQSPDPNPLPKLE
jgi:hypothetical protein